MPTQLPGGDKSVTHVVELTPPGRAAVAVVLVTGPKAIAAIDQCFHSASAQRLEDIPPGRICLGRWNSPVGDELIACRRSDDAIEIHCHGGIAAVRAVVNRLRDLGCQPIDWQEWLRKTEVEPIRAAAQIALATAPTARTAAVLLDQFHGALDAAIRATLAAATADDWPRAAAILNAILAHQSVGLHLTKPWRVVLAGRPNVGKSSLMNALVGFERAIVCDLPGTTRDVVTATTAIDGWPIEFFDTAGLRQTQDEIELEGVARTTTAAAEADLVLLVDDKPTEPDSNLLASTAPVLRVLNKIDLVPPAQRPSNRLWHVQTSALTGQGIASLIADVNRSLVPKPPAPVSAVPFTAEQAARCEVACAAVEREDLAAVVLQLQPLLA